jgi:hypothetical protein
VHNVVLLGGPLAARRWSHETQAAANQRADALADLHSAKTSEVMVDGELTITVHADAYYTPRPACPVCGWPQES